jgi:hypothetical protein
MKQTKLEVDKNFLVKEQEEVIDPQRTALMGCSMGQMPLLAETHDHQAQQGNSQELVSSIVMLSGILVIVGISKINIIDFTQCNLPISWASN